MKQIFQTKVFKAAFLFGICLFMGLNSFPYWTGYTRQLFHKFGPFSIYDADAIGIPFSFYIWGSGGPRWSAFYWSELIADVLIALIASFVIGFAANAVLSKGQYSREIGH